MHGHAAIGATSSARIVVKPLHAREHGYTDPAECLSNVMVYSRQYSATELLEFCMLASVPTDPLECL